MDGVSIQDYAQIASGTGMNDEAYNSAPQTMEQVDRLNKALAAGDITGGASVDSSVPGQGAALKVESLERNLKLLTFRESDIRQWRLFPKTPAFNTVEEFNQLASYGAERGGSYMEGELPEEEDSTYTRRSEKVKFYGVTKSVTHPMQLVNSAVGNVVQQEINNGTMWLLRKINRSLAFGDENIVPTEVNGAYKQHQIGVGGNLDTYFNEEVVVDLHGASLTQQVVEEAGTAILNNFGQATHLFAAPGTLSDFGKDYYEKQRIFLGGNQQGYNEGINISYPKRVTLSFGDVALEHDIFLKSTKAKTTASTAESNKAPSAPVADVTTPVAVVASPGTSNFLTGDAGDYQYAVAAVNRYGESALTTLGAATTVAAGQAVDLKFAAGTGSYNPTGYTIYRTMKDGTGTFYPLFKVSTADLSTGYDGGAASVVRDKNRFMANTEQAYVADVPNTFNVKQLAPLMKMDLAIVSPAYRFMILAYWTLFLTAPKKMVRFVNIGAYVKP